jgi:hypothetical protein
VPPLSRITSCNPTKPIPYFANSLQTAIFDPALFRHLTFRVPNLMSIFRCLDHSKRSVQVRGPVQHFATCWFFTVRRFSPFVHPSIWRTTLRQISATAHYVYIRNYPPYPEDCLTPSLLIGTITNIMKNMKRLLSMFGHVSTFSTISTRSVLVSPS